MLSAAARMRRRAEFSETVRNGRRSAAPSLVLHLSPGGCGGPRVGFVTSRALGSAVVRNRVRRRLAPLVRARLAQLPSESMLVVRATPAAATASSARLAADLDHALSRLTLERAR